MRLTGSCIVNCRDPEEPVLVTGSWRQSLAPDELTLLNGSCTRESFKLIGPEELVLLTGS